MTAPTTVSPKSPETSTRLVRELTFWPLFFVTVANMIGTGIFTTSGFILRDVGSAGAMLAAWLIGGLFALLGAFCYAELGAMFPAAGGDYVFLRESLGRRVAFLSGWISLWVGFSAPIAAAAMAFAIYVGLFLPSDLSQPVVTKLLAVGVILLFTWVHRRGLLFGARLQSFLSLAKIVLIVSIIVGAWIWGQGSWAHFASPAGSSTLLSGPFATSLIFVSFAYSGWNASAYLGGEIREPERNIPRSILFATLAVMAMYLSLNVVYVYALEPARMQGAEEVGGLAVQSLFGDRIGSLFNLAIAGCLLSTLSAMVMTGPRVYYAMARDKLFFQLFNVVDRAHHVPARSILLQAAIAILLALTATFYTLLVYIGFVLTIFTSLTVLGMIVLRVKEPARARPYRTWGYPLTPLLFLSGNAWVVIYSVSSNPVAFIWGAATIAIGWLVFDCIEGKFAFMKVREKR